MNQTIVVERYGNGFKAYVLGEPARWAFGRSRYEAIGDLIVHHAEAFSIEVEL